ncbi:hypothetical protein KO506_14140 [Polaribacter vadi]|uniref:hypothetical protein n=1 Tax=Polaribacter TaxID=52959 RepID=UPI001C096647|nr:MULTISPECIES: hypothetical protein [Polaribacter]MBU3012549.1 hypothetical protein [Polaribacter vadi]MDO6742366.1 hypothetical protein [Polaribacter sp. 1_MG-2023]
MENLENYTTTIDLTGTRAKQFVFAGQLYGTFFAIFATFNLNKEKSSDTKKIIDSILLDIINYKGLVNIGIVGAKLDTSTKSYSSVLPNSNTISINLQALCNNKKDVNVTGVKDLDLTKGSWLIFDRKLTKIDRTINPDVWDQEFDYRDGIFEKKNIKRYDDEARNLYIQQTLSSQQIIESKTSGGLIDKGENMIDDVNGLIGKDENLGQINSTKGVTQICVVGQSKILF